MPDRLADDRPQQGLLQRVRRFLHDDLIGSFKKELDDLVMDAHAQARDEIRRVLDMAVTHSEERVRVTIEELARPLREKEQGALEAFSAELIGRRRRELEAQVHATRAEIERLLEQERETLRARVEADVRSAVDKARQSCDQQVEEASAAVSKAGEIADLTLQKRTARLEDFGREFESGLLERQRTRLLELSASGLEGFRASAETLLQKLRDEAQSSLATLVERVDEDHGNRIRTRSEELSAGSRNAAYRCKR